MRHIATNGVAWPVCSSIGLSVMTGSPAKTGWTDHRPLMLFGLLTRVEPCIGWGPHLRTWSSNFEGEKGHVRRSIHSKRLTRG